MVNQYALGAFAIGELARRDFERWGIEPARIHFLPYSVAGLEPQLGDSVADETHVRFLQAGVLCHRKGTDTLIEAFACVHARHPRTHLDLVGNDTSDGEYAKLALRLGVAHAVTFHGAVKASLVARYMSEARVVLLVSRFDGWGVALNEAASLGRALISTDVTGAAHHLVRDGWNGYRIPPGDIAALAQAMSQYAVTPGLAVEHGARSRDLFADFTPVSNAQRFRQGLAALLAV